MREHTSRSYDPAQLESVLKSKLGRTLKYSNRDGVQFTTICPSCGKLKLSVNANLGIYNCWRGCGSGTVSSLLKGITDGSIKIDRMADTTIVKEKPKYVSPGNMVSLKELNQDHNAIKYLNSRGFDSNIVGSIFGCKYCHLGREFAQGYYNTTNSLIFPIFMNSKLEGWQSRLLYDPDSIKPEDYAKYNFVLRDGKYRLPPKYLTMPGMDKRQLLWNFDWARQSNVVVVCEGVFDAIRVGKCAVATLGKNISDEQLGLLLAYWDLRILLLDPDAKKESTKVARKISAVNVTLPSGTDPGSTPKDTLWTIILTELNSKGIDIKKYKITK